MRNPIEVRLCAVAVIYWYRAKLVGLCEWAAEVLGTARECLAPSHARAPPLLQGLREVQSEEAYEQVAQAMPGDCGITPEHIANYTARFCRNEGLCPETSMHGTSAGGKAPSLRRAC